MSFQKVTQLTLAAALMLSTPAYADSSAAAAAAPAAQSSSSNILETLKKKMKASYMVWLTGPNAQALSGNVAGGGTNLSLAHYPSIGYRLTSKMSLSATQPFTQTIDEVPAEQADPFIANDPYLTLSHGSLASNEKYGFNLSGYARYYAPFSRTTSQRANAADRRDQGKGAVRLLVTPSKTFMDGALTLAGTTLVQYRLPKNNSAQRAAKTGNSMREDYFFLFNPSVAYTVNSKLEAYVEYATGTLIHNTGNGNMTKLNNPAAGQYVSPGVNWTVTKRLLVNPYVAMGPVFRGVRNTDIGMIATYTFL